MLASVNTIALGINQDVQASTNNFHKTFTDARPIVAKRLGLSKQLEKKTAVAIKV